MKIYDISVSYYNGMPVFPGDPPPDIKRILSMPDDPANVSMMCMGTHTGTHVDPPIHFIHGGYTVDDIPLDHLYGKAEVVDLTHIDKVISKDDLRDTRSKIILLKTKNSGLWKSQEFVKDYVYIDESAATWLVDNGVKTVGIDYLSIAGFESGEPVHKILLGGKVTVIEGLNLTDIEPGEYTLACLPLKIQYGDGAPARAILVKE
ncbi:cyclase [Methanocella sp. CWC-04]|uniref:Cyclase n=1 Tax=Methanooceanicella nereidis TaxID=2052831 RepID=A0AAP2W7J6_9EURY|nr:cyclase family protein [Methanocella sp. CWC-04]MCD1295136.1 cyclase [Methanocella sp. CWC-04]